MIKLAYDRMIDGIGRLSFPYLNKILKSWYENKWLNVQDVTEKDILNRSKEKVRKRPLMIWKRLKTWL